MRDIKDSFYEKLVCAFDQVPQYHTKILQLYEELECAFDQFCKYNVEMLGNSTTKVGGRYFQTDSWYQEFT
jgi:hypothetical protein